MRLLLEQWGGQRIENALQDRAKAEGKSVEEERTSMLSIQDLKQFVDPKDIASLCVFLTSDAGKSISGMSFQSTWISPVHAFGSWPRRLVRPTYG